MGRNNTTAHGSTGPHRKRVTSPGFQPSEKLAEVVLRHIARDIIEGQLHPGQHLRELALCEELGVSRSPVREAIHRLAAEGLVDLVPRKGAFVAELTPEEVRDVFEVRTQLEALSVRLAAERASDREVAELDAINRQCAGAVDAHDFNRFFECNDALHHAIGDIAGNDYLQRMRNVAAARTFRPLFLYLSSISHLRRSIVDHTELISAISAGHQTDAERTIRRHLESAMLEAERLVEAARSRSGPTSSSARRPGAPARSAAQDTKG